MIRLAIVIVCSVLMACGSIWSQDFFLLLREKSAAIERLGGLWRSFLEEFLDAADRDSNAGRIENVPEARSEGENTRGLRRKRTGSLCSLLSECFSFFTFSVFRSIEA